MSYRDIRAVQCSNGDTMTVCKQENAMIRYMACFIVWSMNSTISLFNIEVNYLSLNGVRLGTYLHLQFCFLSEEDRESAGFCPSYSYLIYLYAWTRCSMLSLAWALKIQLFLFIYTVTVQDVQEKLYQSKSWCLHQIHKFPLTSIFCLLILTSPHIFIPGPYLSPITERKTLFVQKYHTVLPLYFR